MTRRIFPLMKVHQEPGYEWATVRYLRRLVAEHRIPFHKLGHGKVLIDLADLDNYVDRGRIENPGPALRPQRGGRGRSPNRARHHGTDGFTRSHV